MHIKIEYCVVWNYYSRAVGLAEEIEKDFGVKAELQKSSGGRFEVYLNDAIVFSKMELMRFPETGETGALIRKRNK